MNPFKIATAGLLLTAMIAQTACNKEYLNPSTASEAAVNTSVDGLMNLAAGLQRRFTIGRQSPLYNAPVAGAYSIGALRTLNIGNAAELEVEAGKSAITKTNAIVTNLWSQSLITRTEAESILKNLGVAVDPGDKVGLKAFASIFYALSTGTLVQFFEKVPVTVGLNAVFSPRADALAKAIEYLESADADLATTAPSAKFISRVPVGIDIKNTVKALLARYYNMQSMITGTYNATAGNKAIANAQAVNVTVKSQFNFLPATPNPVAEWNLTKNVFGATDSTLGLKNGLAPNPPGSDPRVGFYIGKDGTIYPLRGFALSTTTPFPVYLPGEMLLIIAENYARQNKFPESKTALDAVRTKTNDVWGVNAAQGAYTGALTQDALLVEIYRQRRLELFASGLELEDSRRFNRPGPGQAGEERNRNFYPYPQVERDNNTNTPEDPAV